MAANRQLLLLTAAFALLVLPACHSGRAADGASAVGHQSDIALFSSLPIYWGEQDDVAVLAGGSGQSGWVRQAIERHGTVAPLDALERPNLAGVERLMLAQPRPLAPSENVALDDWVRGGGRLLVFADPALTWHSRYHLGDKRRPLDTVLLSPILARWGLTLRFDEDQPPGERLEPVNGQHIPINLGGHFVSRAGGHEAQCALSGNGLLVRCTVGKGRVTLLADAALLEDADEGAVDQAQRGALLDRLLAESLGD